MSMFSSEKYTPCESRLKVEVSGEIIHCVRNAQRCREESGFHIGVTPAGIHIKWTTEEGLISFRLLPEKRKVIGALMGWRTWKIYTPRLLRSISADVLWKTPVMTTPRDSEGKPLPVLKAVAPSPETGWRQLGIFSYKSLRLLRSEMSFGYGVVGQIDNTGQIIEHTLGYRSQIATVRKLWTSFKECVEDFSKTYDCPVFFIENLDKWASYFSDHEEELENEYR